MPKTKSRNIHLYAAFFRFKRLEDVDIKVLSMEYDVSEYRFTGMVRSAKHEGSIVDGLLDAGYDILEIPEWFFFTDYHLLLREKAITQKSKTMKIDIKPDTSQVSPNLKINERGFEVPYNQNSVLAEQSLPNWRPPLQSFHGYNMPIINYDDHEAAFLLARSERAHVTLGYPNFYYSNVRPENQVQNSIKEDVPLMVAIMDKPPLLNLLFEARARQEEMHEHNRRYIDDVMCAIIDFDMKITESKWKKEKPKKGNKKTNYIPDMFTEIQNYKLSLKQY